MGQKTQGLVVIGGVTVFLVLLVAASFLADEQRAVPVSRLQRTTTDSPHALAPSKEHWYASGQGPDDSHHPITWRDVIRSNYPAEPRYGPSEAELYREDPSSTREVGRCRPRLEGLSLKITLTKPLSQP